MNPNRPTDLQIAQDLEKLAGVIHESIERAENTLQQIKKVNEVNTLIARIDGSCEELLKAQETVKRTQDRTSNHLQEVKAVEQRLNNLKEIPKQLEEIGISGTFLEELNLLLDNVNHVKKETQNTRLELRNLQEELLSTKQQMIAVQNFENYLQDLQNIRNRKQLWKWLKNELGFVGIVVYILSLITPKQKQ
jgi:chromosome segregation ATPase